MNEKRGHENAVTPVWVLVAVGCVLSTALLGSFLRSMSVSLGLSQQAAHLRAGWLEVAKESDVREHRLAAAIMGTLTSPSPATPREPADADGRALPDTAALRSDPVLASAVDEMENTLRLLPDLLRRAGAWRVETAASDAATAQGREELVARRDALIEEGLRAQAELEARRTAAAGLVVKEAAKLDEAVAASLRATLTQSILAVLACASVMLVLGRRVAKSIRGVIQELAEAAGEIRAKEAQLAQSQRLEAIGQLAAGIAHEINTPVHYTGDNLRFLSEQFTGVFWVLDAYFTELAEGAPSKAWAERREEMNNKISAIDFPFLREEVPKAFEAALDGLERVSTIVRAMKDFSHPGAKDKQSTDLNRAVESTVTVCRHRWKYAAELNLELDKKLPRVPCMVAELNQVLLNLIVNAADAIVERHGEGHLGQIKVSTRLDGEWAEIRVADNGAGIPDSVRAKIYDPFFTTKGVGKGTGQGLAISRDIIVNKHGGTIDCESKRGEGTEFIIRLPLTDPQAKAAELREAA